VLRRRARVLALGVAGSTAGSVLACANLDALTGHSDASVEAASSDASAADGADAAVGDATGGDAADGPWCATQPAHTRCFDFDTVGTVEVGWDSNNISTGGAVALDKSTFRSAPASMQSSVTDGLVTGGTFAVLLEDIASSASTVTCAFDIKAELGDGSTYAANANLFILYYGAGGAVSLGVSSMGPAVSWLVPTSTNYESGSYALSAFPADSTGWTHIEISVTLGQPWTVTVTFDGLLEFQQSLGGSVTTPDAGILSSFGTVGLSGKIPLAINYDNITIDVR
jgi:hypothetical protein